MSWKDMFSGGSSNVPWKEMTAEAQISEIVERSHENPQLIFKHSTRCSISSMAKSRLEREWNLENVEPWYLDLIAYRNISNAIASQLSVHHESPQAILLKDAIVVYDSSHNSISVSEISKHVS
ncbi:MAG: bacillithiol system redox-active protein YtxJ [Flavobacteriales bacterium]|nr:bacillithiol system redox-active protein YtxJ [Flavobacteriales bacterium]